MVVGSVSYGIVHKQRPTGAYRPAAPLGLTATRAALRVLPSRIIITSVPDFDRSVTKRLRKFGKACLTIH